MAGRSLGTLTLDLTAKIGGFTAGMNQAEREAAKSAKRIEESLKGISVTSFAIGTAIGGFLKDGITAIVGAFPALIDGAAKFQDLSEMTGVAAEDIASFAVASATAGVSIEDVASAMNKLTKNLVGVDDESKAAGAALAAIGINVAEFKKLNPAEQYEQIGKALSGYADGAGKTAVALATMGKEGAAQLKVFKALEEQGGRTSILTKEQSALADEYADKNAKLKAEIGLYASAIATQALPALSELTKSLINVAKETFGVTVEAGKLGASTGVRDFAQSAAVALAGFVENIGNAVAAVGTMLRAAQSLGAGLRLAFEVQQLSSPVGLAKGALDGFKGVREAYANGQQSLDTLSNSFKTTIDRAKVSEGKKLRELFNVQNADAADKNVDRLRNGRKPPTKPKPEIDYNGGAGKSKKGGGGAKDDPAKAILDNNLKALSDSIEQEKELFQSRNKFLDLYYSQGLISVKDYYAQRQAILDEATANQSKAYDEQAAALQKAIASAPKEQDKASLTGKLNEVLAKQAKLHRDAGNAATEASIKQTQAQKEVQAAVDEVNAKLLEFNGNLREAAAIRFDAQNEKLKLTFTAEGNETAKRNLETLRAYTLAQADLNKLQEQFSLAQGDLQIAEERITIARDRGTMGEIESLRASGEARQKAVGLLRQQLAAYEAIDNAARSPAQNQAIERLRVQLEGLEATLDPLADKFNTMFGEAAGSAFGDFITGAKTAKEAANDFLKSVTNQISQMVAKDLGNKLFKSLFADAGDGKGIGGILSQIFGGTLGNGGGVAGLFGKQDQQAGGGVGDVLGEFLGSKGLLTTESTAAAAGMASLTAGTTSATAGLATLTSAAAAAATSLGSQGITGAFGDIGKAIAGANSVGADGDVLGEFIKLAGFAEGGYTGTGSKHEPAGIVHRGEYVFDAGTTKRIGVNTLERIKEGAYATPFWPQSLAGSDHADEHQWPTGIAWTKPAADASHQTPSLSSNLGGLSSNPRAQSSNLLASDGAAPSRQTGIRSTVNFNGNDVTLIAQHAANDPVGVFSTDRSTDESSVYKERLSEATQSSEMLERIVENEKLLKLAGFSDGGYTGPGGKTTPAGIVHKGEYVLDAATTRRIGVHNLDRLIEDERVQQVIKGFADGGFTGRGPTNEVAGITHRGEYVVDAPTTKRIGPSVLNEVTHGRLDRILKEDDVPQEWLSPSVRVVIDQQTTPSTLFAKGDGFLEANDVSSQTLDTSKFSLERLLDHKDSSKEFAQAFRSESSERTSTLERLVSNKDSSDRQTSNSVFMNAENFISKSLTQETASSVVVRNERLREEAEAMERHFGEVDRSEIEREKEWILKMPGFSSGGFTGVGPSNAPAGIVHKGEYVMDADTTRRLGVANLNNLSAGGAPGVQQTNNFVIQGRIDRSTQTQISNKLRRETLVAGARF